MTLERFDPLGQEIRSAFRSSASTVYRVVTAVLLNFIEQYDGDPENFGRRRE